MPERWRSVRTMTPSPPNMTIAAAAEYLGVDERAIRNMLADGRLTGYRLGAKLIRLRRSEIDASLQPFGGAV